MFLNMSMYNVTIMKNQMVGPMDDLKIALFLIEKLTKQSY